MVLTIKEASKAKSKEGQARSRALGQKRPATPKVRSNNEHGKKVDQEDHPQTTNATIARAQMIPRRIGQA